MQPAPLLKGCWVPSPALSGSHKGLSSVGWEGMTLEDFGSVCVCVCVAFVCVSVCAWDVLASQHAWLCLHMITCVHSLRCACMRVFSLLFSLRDFVLKKVCQPVSWEKTWSEAGAAVRTGTKTGEKTRVGQAGECETGANSEKWRRSEGNLLWTWLQMFVHCKYRKHKSAARTGSG